MNHQKQTNNILYSMSCLSNFVFFLSDESKQQMPSYNSTESKINVIAEKRLIIPISINTYNESFSR